MSARRLLSTRRKPGPALGLVLGLSAALAGCDDQIKYLPVFSTMAKQPSVEAYEEEAPRTRVPGTVAVGEQPTYGLIAADTALTNPLAGTAAEVERGAELYGQFCTPCHGPAGAGDGSVTGPNRIPTVQQLPLLNLLSAQTRGYSDGYLWGMITNGRGLMPSYRRIPAGERWNLVTYVRELQRLSPLAEAGHATPATEANASVVAGERAGEASEGGG